MRFDECLPVILQFEGGYIDDHVDHGGVTNKGITQRTYDAWHGSPFLDVKDITDDEVATIYKENYWTELPRLLDLCVFDAAVQHGKGKAIKFLQELIGSGVDGVCGKNTLYAINTYTLRHSTKELLQAYQARRRGFYKAIIAKDPIQQKFANGWENRMKKLEEVLYGM